ncbi:MAG TPA: hypothetical protein VFN53_04925 [Acidobacteriaceae bacterium]|nr:hypothetical protein [Acidobacteriaceae bacterium]
MTAVILGAATLILVALIAWRRISREFYRRSELPKFQVLANLGLGTASLSDRDISKHEPELPTEKGTDEEHQP